MNLFENSKTKWSEGNCRLLVNAPAPKSIAAFKRSNHSRYQLTAYRAATCVASVRCLWFLLHVSRSAFDEAAFGCLHTLSPLSQQQQITAKLQKKITINVPRSVSREIVALIGIWPRELIIVRQSRNTHTHRHVFDCFHSREKKFKTFTDKKSHQKFVMNHRHVLLLTQISLANWNRELWHATFSLSIFSFLITKVTLQLWRRQSP